MGRAGARAIVRARLIDRCGSRNTADAGLSLQTTKRIGETGYQKAHATRRTKKKKEKKRKREGEREGEKIIVETAAIR